MPIKYGIQEMYESGESVCFDPVHQKFNVGNGLGGIIYIHFHKRFLLQYQPVPVYWRDDDNLGRGWH